MELKGREAERFLAAPKPGSLLLLHGPDGGLVQERAKSFIDRALEGSDDPFARITLETTDLTGDPQRLSDEAFTVALFGGLRAIRLRISDLRPVMPAVTPLLATPPEGSVVVLEAGELRKDVALRKAFEKDGRAVAIACYADEGRALDDLIEDALKAHGLSIDREALSHLKASLGADRAAIRGELEKLALYAAGRTTITSQDVAAIVTNAAISSVDGWLDDAFCGRTNQALDALDDTLDSGTQPVALSIQLLRHVQALHRMASQVAMGASPRSVVEQARPPVFFRRKQAFIEALERHDLYRLDALLKDVRALDLDVRRTPQTASARLTLITLRLASTRRR